MIRLALVVLAVAGLALTPAFAAGTATRVTIPDSTDVAVQLDTPLTSAESNLDDVVNVHVVGAVNVSGYVVIANNAKGRGHVIKLVRAGGHGHAGSIVVVIDYVYAVDGLKVKLKSTPFLARGDQTRGDANVVGFFTFGIGSNAVRGGDATLDTSRMLVTSVDGTVHIASSQPAEGPNANAQFAK
ncbi:MAG: hypothetical protein ACRENA_14495 [Vulcanimicrobiaceae bacterium]